MAHDHIDRVVAEWRRERPDLDPSGLEVVARVGRVASLLEGRLAERLAAHGIGIPGYAVLAALRRAGPPFERTPGELSREVMLTSGAMTNRLDRLERAELVERRRPVDGDRRSIRIHLTRTGRGLIDEAIASRLEAAGAALEALEAGERDALAAALRKLAIALEGEAAGDRSPRSAGATDAGAAPD